MATGSMETAIMSDPTIKLPDDLLVEIISRVPFKSTRCCKCVSTRWRDLISHPDHRDKLPRSTLAGFFCKNRGMDCDPRFHDVYHSVSGDWCPFDDSLSFLPEYEELDILDCCNGLLLCLCSQPYAEKPDYVVCNPATEKWVTFPANRIVSFARLGFDPAVSSHFHVFELVPINSKVDMIIGSKRWGSTLPKLEGNCRIIPLPTSHDAPIVPNVYVSRGQLYLTNRGASELSIWVLEDSSSEDCWTLKLNVSYLQLFGEGYSSRMPYYGVISAHPEHNMAFVTIGLRSGFQELVKLFSYDVDSRELCFVSDLGWYVGRAYLSYVPLFSESLADGH
uniref:F-box domain-containing protein n=1 Tax=Triticum aestivum TaxID=4565 RepID=A0A077RWL4_WHEAT|nr:unnamed protein product [Triticum aestivum]CDM82927.1 unnamed protein product [Triticum aestivum]